MIGNKKILSIITARAGSKGIPGKNYRELLGKPLFIWSVLASMNSKYVDTTIISSNCNECSTFFAKFLLTNRKMIEDEEKDVLFQFRPEEISGDLSKNEDALIHAYEMQKKNEKDFDVIINLQPTSPSRVGLTKGLLDECIEMYQSGGYDSLLTANKETPFLWQKINGKWEYPVDKNGCCNRKMRQEFIDNDEESEFLLHDNGNIYIVDTKILLDKQCRIGYNPCIYETHGMDSLQIDTEFDFKLIEEMSKVYGISSLV